MEIKKRIIASLLIIILLLITFYFLTYNITKLTGKSISTKITGFEECLKDQNIILYINGEDTDNELKNTGLGEYLEYFKIKNCFRNSKLCEEEGINYFPTWIINNKKIKGKLSISELKSYTNC